MKWVKRFVIRLLEQEDREAVQQAVYARAERRQLYQGRPW